ncbi:Low-density lipoprotein receptor-related protein 1 [Merluccius polli]|uniref:Low-density lipoprotein receptor-related protein 1 n=1 Tax=Merluccius polli TaxID=89951 RepID=A0AA47NUZ3_MERPO|nr:Low-density lipoprotein receptor-related protein 1 [Merluccius polli]
MGFGTSYLVWETMRNHIQRGFCLFSLFYIEFESKIITTIILCWIYCMNAYELGNLPNKVKTREQNVIFLKKITSTLTVSPRCVPVPVDRLPVLLIANSQNIQATSLSGITVHSLLSTTTKQTTAMDFLYTQEMVCWIHVGDSPASTHLKCAKIPNLKSFTEERVINISLSLHREYRCNTQQEEQDKPVDAERDGDAANGGERAAHRK